MKKLLLVLLAVLLTGCSSNVNASPESVIKGYMKGIVEKDSALVTQCLDTDNKVEQLIDNNYTQYTSLKIQKLPIENSSLYAYTGMITYGEDLSVPYLNVVEVTNKDDLYYIVSESIKDYSDLGVEKLNALKESDIYNTYKGKLEAFLSEENLNKVFKSVEDFKSSEEYQQYMNELSSFINSEEAQSIFEQVKDLPNSELYQNLKTHVNEFVNSDEYKNIESSVKDFLNSKEVQNIYNKLTEMFK